MDDFGVGAQGDATPDTVDHATDNPPFDLRGLRPVVDLLDLLAEITGVEVKADTSNTRAPLPERFSEFHQSNPGVYAALRTYCYQRLRAGRKRLSIAHAFEQLRELSIQTNGDPWLIDNSFKPFYVRLLMLNEPPLRGLFEVRASVADEWIAQQAAQMRNQAA